MSVCVLQNLEKYRVLWTDFLASCREINRFSVSKIGPEPAKPTISLALVLCFHTAHLCVQPSIIYLPVHTLFPFDKLVFIHGHHSDFA